MKKILLITFVLLSFFAKAQYTPMTAKGYEFKYLKEDSGHVFAVRDTFHNSFVQFGSAVVRPQDSSLYIYTTKWNKIAATAGVINNNKVDSVKVFGDTLYYFINGVAHGNVFAITALYPDSLYFQSTTGDLNLRLHGGSTLTTNLDNRYLQVGGGIGTNIATAAQNATGSYTHNWNNYDITFTHIRSWNQNSAQIHFNADSLYLNSGIGVYNYSNTQVSDTNTIKPAGFDAGGNLKRLSYWPAGGTGGSSLRFGKSGEDATAGENRQFNSAGHKFNILTSDSIRIDTKLDPATGWPSNLVLTPGYAQLYGGDTSFIGSVHQTNVNSAGDIAINAGDSITVQGVFRGTSPRNKVVMRDSVSGRLYYYDLNYLTLSSLSATSPIFYNNTTGVISSQAGTTSQNGYITSTDWNTFNGKQAALSGTGFVKISGTTISYDNSTYVPSSRTLTINGVAHDLSADRSWTIATSGSYPIVSATDTGVVTPAMKALWDGKQSALSGTGYAKWSGSTPSYLTPTQVTADLNVFTSSLQGLVPASGGSMSKVLHADGFFYDTSAALHPPLDSVLSYGNSTTRNINMNSSASINFNASGGIVMQTGNIDMFGGTIKLRASLASELWFINTGILKVTGPIEGGLPNLIHDNTIRFPDSSGTIALLSNIPTGLPPSGSAGGDLSGSYPNPTVAKINGTSLAGLSTGILKNTTTTGVPSIAVAADFPTLNQNTTGSAATLTTSRNIYGNAFNGSADVTGIIASTYGGTGNGFTKFSGPASSEKTFTLPNASATILTTNALVTVAQGGTGAATLTGILKGNGTSAFTAAAAGTDYQAPITRTDDNLTLASNVIGTNKTPVSLTYGSTTTWNAQNGYNAYETVTGNTTLSITNTQAGGFYTVTFYASGGTWTVTLPGGGTLSVADSATTTGYLRNGGWEWRTTGTSGGGTYTADESTLHLSTTTFSIKSTYPGQPSITTLGTIGTGVWNGTLVGATYGGTGVNNGSSTITLGGNLITSGAFATTLTSTATTNATLPAGTNTLYSTKSASISSSQLATSLSDETGTGNAMFSASPTTTGTLTAAAINMSGALTVGGASDFSSQTIQGYTAKYNVQTGTSYTLLSSDAGKIITLNNASTITVTVPSGLPTGFTCTIIQLGAGKIQFTTSSTTLHNSGGFTSTNAQYAVCSITMYASDVFVLGGELQ